MITTREVLESISETIPSHAVVVSSLGRTAEEAFRVFPGRTLFLDAMGDVTPVAFGLALGLGPEVTVVALDTDGSHLFGLAGLPAFGALAPMVTNLLVVVLDNEMYESAGGMPSRSIAIDWKSLGTAFQLPIQPVDSTSTLRQELRSAFQHLTYLVVPIQNNTPLGDTQKNIDAIESKYRVIRHLEKHLARRIWMPAIKS